MAHADVTSAPLPSCFPPSFWVDVGLYRGEPGVKCDSDACPPLQQGRLLAQGLTRKSLMLLLAGPSRGGGGRTEPEVK